MTLAFVQWAFKFMTTIASHSPLTIPETDSKGPLIEMTYGESNGQVTVEITLVTPVE